MCSNTQGSLCDVTKIVHPYVSDINIPLRSCSCRRKLKPNAFCALNNMLVCCCLTHLFLPDSPVDVAHQFQYAVRVIGSNYAPTIERDEFLVSEKIKKECECGPVAQSDPLPRFLRGCWTPPSIPAIVDSGL